MEMEGGERNNANNILKVTGNNIILYIIKYLKHNMCLKHMHTYIYMYVHICVLLCTYICVYV